MSSRSPSPAWTPLERSRFHEVWDALPALTILAALPGWGATEWMHQCRAHRGADARWVQDSATLARMLADPSAPPADVYVDDVPLEPEDPRWGLLAAAAARGAHIVVSAADPPAEDLLAGIPSRVLTEADLAFDPDEVDELIARNRLAIGPDTRGHLVTDLRGCPLLVRTQIERLRTRRAHSVWAGLAFALERPLLEHLRLGEGAPRGGFGMLLRRGTAFRRFSKELVSAPGDVAAQQFARLEAYPLGSMDADDETGAREFVWSSAAWSALDDLIPPRRRRAELAAGAERLRDEGRAVQLLFPLLALRRFAEADAVVFQDFRRFLLFTDGPTQDALLTAAPDCGDRPSLQLLASELRLRVHGANRQSVTAAARCLDAFRSLPPDSALMRFRLQCRAAMAATLAGQRSAAVRQLEQIAAAIDPAADSVIRREAAADRAVADTLAADLFLAFWSSVQVDRHAFALAFVEAMQEWGDPSSIVTRIDRLTAMTEQDFAGLRSLDPDGARPDDLEYSHAAALVLLEEGMDAEAVERTHPLASRARPAPTRSAADALLILARALAAPGALGAAIVDTTVQRSAAFWDDGEPSTFIAFAATVARLGSDTTGTRRARTRDWFTGVARALDELAASRPAEAAVALEQAGPTSLPRLAWIHDLLTATTYLRMERDDAADARLSAAWGRVPAPRLVRFAARFVSVDDFLLLRAAADRLGGRLASALASADDDLRPVGRAPRITLTPAERELLALLRQGASNGDLAAIRGTTMNTVRSQLRTLYRKIGATDRAAATAYAEMLLTES